MKRIKIFKRHNLHFSFLRIKFCFFLDAFPLVLGSSFSLSKKFQIYNENLCYCYKYIQISYLFYLPFEGSSISDKSNVSELWLRPRLWANGVLCGAVCARLKWAVKLSIVKVFFPVVLFSNEDKIRSLPHWGQLILQVRPVSDRVQMMSASFTLLHIFKIKMKSI